MAIPLFKSHYSIGKSILTLNPPKELGDKDSPDSVFDIAQEGNLSKVALVEDSFMGFLQAKKIADNIGIDFVFGIRFDVCENVSDQEPEALSKCSHKLVIFSKSSSGCKILNQIYTDSKTKYSGWLDLDVIKSHWSEKDLLLAVPFYDSFLFNNLTTFTSCIPNFSFTSPTFFVEENGLPFDSLVNDSIKDYCDLYGFETQNSQSIYYRNKTDFSAYLTYKLTCGRNSFAGRALSLERPNFDHMGTDEFCWESYLQKYEIS
mgnify:CR=1 FL=1